MSETILITGAPGSGKTTLQNKIIKQNPNYRVGLDYTTRIQREGEVNGLSRIFISESDFIRLFNQGFFVEQDLDYAKYNGAFYGTPLDIASSEPPKVSVISALGVAQILKTRFPETIWVHLFANKDELVRRLIRRGENNSIVNYRTDENNSDPGTFNQISVADINIDTSTYSMDQVVEYLSNFVNLREQ